MMIRCELEASLSFWSNRRQKASFGHPMTFTLHMNRRLASGEGTCEQDSGVCPDLRDCCCRGQLHAPKPLQPQALVPQFSLRVQTRNGLRHIGTVWLREVIIA